MMQSRPLSFRSMVTEVMGVFAVTAGSCLLGGCATYRAMTLDESAVNSALQPPSTEGVKIAAAKLAHPLLQPLVIDGRDGFSPDEVALMAVVVSPKLRALRDQRGVARAQLVQAGVLPNPQLGYTLDRPSGNDDPSLVNGTSLGLSWEVTSLLAHRDNVSAAKATAEALDLDIAWQEWQMAQDVRLRAFRLLSLEQRLPFAREIETDRADILALITTAYARGYQTGLDLTTATAAWNEAQDNRFELEREIAADRLDLNVAIGLPPDQSLKLKPGATFPTLPADAASAAVLLQGLEKRRLDLVALTLGYESQEASLRAAVKSQFPKIGLSLSQAKDTSDIKSRGFGVTIDLPLFDRNQGQIAIAQATRQQLFDEYVARVAEARTEVAQILAKLAITRTQLQAAAASMPDLERLVAAYEEAFKTRQIDVKSYHEGRGALATRRIEQSKLQQDLLELGVALEIATGRPLLNRAAVN